MSAEAAALNTDAAWKPRYNPWLIAVAVTLAAFMEVLDTTIVNVALPHIAGSLSSSSDEATWALTSYLVANGIVLTISGWLGDLFGRKRYFVICIAMFTVCSFLCGTSASLTQLIIYRLAQGFFGGGNNVVCKMASTSRMPRRRSKAFARSCRRCNNRNPNTSTPSVCCLVSRPGRCNPNSAGRGWCLRRPREFLSAFLRNWRVAGRTFVRLRRSCMRQRPISALPSARSIRAFS